MAMKIGRLTVQAPLRPREGSLRGSPAATHTAALGVLVLWGLFSGKKLNLVIKTVSGISPVHSLPQHLWAQEIRWIQVSPESLCLL